MTFGEKLQYLRKEKNWTQEQLAGQIGISRQALSKWEQSTATPDTEHVVRISQLFGISTDALLLDDAVFPPSAAKAASSRRRWELLIGGLAAGLASTGLLILGICASVFPSVHVETKPDQNWIRVYTGLSGFLHTKNLGWLFCLLCLLLAGGIAVLFHPQLQRVWKKLRQRFARKGTPFAEE